MDFILIESHSTKTYFDVFVHHYDKVVQPLGISNRGELNMQTNQHECQIKLKEREVSQSSVVKDTDLPCMT